MKARVTNRWARSPFVQGQSVAVRVVALTAILLAVFSIAIIGLLWRQSIERKYNEHIYEYHLVSARWAEAVERDIFLISINTRWQDRLRQASRLNETGYDDGLAGEALHSIRKNLKLILRKEDQYGEERTQGTLAGLVEVDQSFRSFISSAQMRGELFDVRLSEITSLYQLRAAQLARLHRKQIARLQATASTQRQQADFILITLLVSVLLSAGWLITRMILRIARSDTRLREGRTLLSAVADNVPGGVLRCQVNANRSVEVLYQSEGFADVFGRHLSFGGFDWQGILNSLHPEDRASVLEAIEGAGRTQEDFDCDFRIDIDSTGYCWRRVMASADDTEPGKQVWTVLAVDITDQKEAEEGMRIALSIADEANRSKSRFLASMSHEIRTPMNAVLGFAQILESSSTEQLSERQRECVHQIMTGGHHLLSLIDNVLDLSRIESGRADIALTRVDPASVMAECRTLVTSMAEKEKVKLIVPGSGGVPDVLADPTRLRQVLLNLMTNAIKYNKAGGSVTVSASFAGSSMIRFAVKDTGEGFPPDMVDELFQPFSRLGREALNIEGTGIGLVISKMLVEQMGGVLGFETNPGEGSTFWIDIPRANDSTLAIEERPMNVVKLVAGGIQRKTILYIEDNPSNVELIKRLLSTAPGVTFVSAPDGEIGLTLAGQVNPDLILLDLNLPGIDGYQVLDKLKEMEETRNCPVIALTALSTDEDIKRGAKAGFSSYITKPFDIRDVEDKVRVALNGKRAVSGQ